MENAAVSDDSIAKFDYTTARYSKENAWWLAKISELSYFSKAGEDREPDSEKILQQLQHLDSVFKSVKGFAKNSAQGVVIAHESFIVAAFRGTDEIGDWLDNINAVAVEHPLGEVHRGFQASLMDVWPGMKTQIRRIRRSSDAAHLPLFITGHSLGGGMATLAAAQLIHADEPFYGVYTYGQPRVGDRLFSRTYNSEAASKTFRFHNNNDIVTRVPARLMGYSHVGTYIYIDEDLELSSNPGAWYRFVDGVRGVASSIGESGFDAIEDHAIGRYLKAIGRSKPGLPE
jgi:triacylglycerol lipase